MKWVSNIMGKIGNFLTFFLTILGSIICVLGSTLLMLYEQIGKYSGLVIVYENFFKENKPFIIVLNVIFILAAISCVVSYFISKLKSSLKLVLFCGNIALCAIYICISVNVGFSWIILIGVLFNIIGYINGVIVHLKANR